MTSGNTDRVESLIVLLVRSAQAYRADIDRHLATTRGVPRILRELNGGQRRLLSLVPPEGARGTALAERAGISKQALGQLAIGLEHAGLIRADTDPTDGRARIWKLTAAGAKAAVAARGTIQAVEEEWLARLGSEDYDRLTSILRNAMSSRAG